MRNWYFVVAVLAVTVLCEILLARGGSVFESKTTVVFTSHDNVAIGTVVEGEQPSLIDFAAAIELVLNDGHQVERFSSASTSLFDAGIREGYQVAMPQRGSQWQYYFAVPRLTVRVVGPTKEFVETTRDRLLNRITASTAQLQSSEGVSDTLAVTADVDSVGSVRSVGPTAGMRQSGLVAFGILGAAVAFGGAVLLDAFVLARSARLARSRPDVSAAQRGN
ncbi:MAG: hypothetical protein JWO10_1663 [Microbacteriaceae bacterium]|nr:hypothetical protein [Microbacteriaceae bacterium]